MAVLDSAAQVSALGVGALAASMLDWTGLAGAGRAGAGHFLISLSTHHSLILESSTRPELAF